MLVPIKWLREYIDLDNSDEEIASILTLGGTNIDSLEKGVMDAEVTSNRPDTLSIYGMARELSALTNTELKALNIPEIINGEKEDITVRIEDEDLVTRYAGYLIAGVQIKESPDWLKEKLNSVGIRSINNIVDITNYIMFLTGQPLHAFDADKIQNGQILIRRAKKGETVRTLDSIDRQLDENAIIIENNGNLIDLAGIMGGELSEVSEGTKNIFLQAAIFNPVLIRRTSKRVKLVTEASYRYERGVDIENCLNYLKKAVEAVYELAGGEVIQAIDIYPQPLEEYAVEWDIARGEHLLGIQIDERKALENLERLGIKNLKISQGLYKSVIPSWRVDLCRKEDIYEEIVRFYPVNSLPRTTLQPKEVSSTDTSYAFKEFLKDILVELGLTEIYGYSFLSRREVIRAGFDPEDCVEVSNPLSEEYQFLRPSLFPGLLTAVFRNPSFDPIAIFEVGHVFSPGKEEERLGIMIAGRGNEHLESVIKSILSKAKTEVGYNVREVTKEILDSFKIRKAKVRYLEISIESMREKTKLKEFPYAVSKMDQSYQPIAKYPSIRRDIAIIVDTQVDPGSVKQSIYQVDPHIRDVELFDVFESERFGTGKKSLAYHITYQSDEKTLSGEEVNTIHSSVIEFLAKEYNASLR